MPRTVPPRNKINKKYTWNGESVFKSHKEWEAEVKSILADAPTIKKFAGRLGESPKTLLEALHAVELFGNRVYKIYMYAMFSYSVDTTNQKASALLDKAQGVAGQENAALSFVNPESIKLG